MQSIYIKLVDEVRQNQLEEENAKNDFFDKLLKEATDDNKED